MCIEQMPECAWLEGTGRSSEGYKIGGQMMFSVVVETLVKTDSQRCFMKGVLTKPLDAGELNIGGWDGWMNES